MCSSSDFVAFEVTCGGHMKARGWAPGTHQAVCVCGQGRGQESLILGISFRLLICKQRKILRQQQQQRRYQKMGGKDTGKKSLSYGI